MTILIVEDNEPMRELLKKLVRDLAEDLMECDDGVEAFEAYRRRRPDRVVMDIRVKELDGLAATRQIKAAFPEARIIIVTGCGDARLRAAAHSAGACGFVLKRTCSSCVGY